jgi:hypothetical protein
MRFEDFVHQVILLGRIPGGAGTLVGDLHVEFSDFAFIFFEIVPEVFKKVNRPEGNLDAVFGRNAFKGGIAVVVHEDDFLCPGLGQVVHHGLQTITHARFVSHMGEEDIAEVVLTLEQRHRLEELSLNRPRHVTLHDADGHRPVFGRHRSRLSFGSEPLSHLIPQGSIRKISRFLQPLQDQVERAGSLWAVFITGDACHAVHELRNLFTLRQFLKFPAPAFPVEIQVATEIETLAAIIAFIFVKHKFSLLIRVVPQSAAAYYTLRPLSC